MATLTEIRQACAALSSSMEIVPGIQQFSPADLCHCRVDQCCRTAVALANCDTDFVRAMRS